VEIAVGAFCLAERNLDVDTETHCKNPIVPHGTAGSSNNAAIRLQEHLLGIRDELDLKFAGAGAVEFGEEDYLPAAERKTALLDKYRFGRADECGFDMRI